jgi:hypothetical protein
MADYYYHCSFLIPLTEEAQRDWAIDELYRDNDDDNENDRYPGVICDESGTAPAIGHDLVKTAEGFKPARLAGDYLWIHDDDSLDIHALCVRLQNIMKHFSVEGIWGFAWTRSCSKPRLDAYCGGACIVSQTEITFMDTFGWLAERGITSSA